MATKNEQVDTNSLLSQGRAENEQDDTKSLPSQGMAENEQDDTKSLPSQGMADFDKLKQYYKKFYEKVDVGSCNDTIAFWKEYRDKILNGTLSLEDFAGKYEGGKKVSKNLVHDLAYEEAFVKSTQTVSGGVTISRGKEKDGDKRDYYKVNNNYTGDSEVTCFYGEEDMKKAEPYFQVCILSLLRLIVTAFDNKKAALNPSDVNGFFPNENNKMFNVLDNKKVDGTKPSQRQALLDKMKEYKADLAKKISVLETSDTQSGDKFIKKDINLIAKIQETKLYEDFSFKQLRLKIMNIESASGTCCDELKHRLLNIVREDLIDYVYCDFFAIDPNEKVSVAVKSYQIMEKAYEMFDIDEDKLDLSAQIGVYKTIWDIYYSKYDFSLDENTPNIIFYGSPGTGKTYTVDKYIYQKSGNAKDKIVNVQCHPGFGYEEFIEGIKPVGFTPNGIKLEIVNGAFKDLCIKAKQALLESEVNNEDPHEFFFVADEINRANLSAMFGETLSLLEADYRDYSFDEVGKPQSKTISTPLSTLIEAYINESVIKDNAAYPNCKAKIDKIKELAYECELYDSSNTSTKPQSVYKINEDSCVENEFEFDNGDKIDAANAKVRNVTFGVPRNIRFIGMMNDVDKSIDAFDLALRRRFKWIEKRCDYKALNRVLMSYTHPKRKDSGINNVKEYIYVCKKLNQYISDDLGFGNAYEFGHAYFMKITNYVSENKITQKNCEDLFEEHLKPVLKEYIRSFYEESRIEECIKSAKVVFTNGMR